MKRIELEQRTEEWRQWRNQGVTATDSAVLLGVNPDKTSSELWFEKTGRTEPEDISVIPAVRYGIENEGSARKLWEWEHETPAPPVCGEWDQNPIFRTSFDGLTFDNEVLEIKCPLPNGNTLLDVKVRGEKSEAYQRYYVQAQHQLLVCDGEIAHLVFLDGENLIEFEIHRDEKMIQEIIQKGEAFYTSLQGDCPPLDTTLWNPRTEEQAQQWNEAAFQYLEAQKQMKELRAVQEVARRKMKELMGNYQRADLAGVKVTRTFAKPTLSLPKIVKKLTELGYAVNEDMLNACQGEASERWSFTESPTLEQARAAPSVSSTPTNVDVEPEILVTPTTWF